MRVTVIGGMNLDMLGSPDQALLPHDSALGKITVRPGGVGRNIAQRLCEAGGQVSLITALGNDDRTAILANSCARLGIDLSHALPTDSPAPSYLCVHDEKGDMVYAVNDMSAMDALTPDAMKTRMDAVNQSDGCVLDANLPESTLSYIAQNAAVPLILDPVSCVKALRAMGILRYLTAVKPNLLEAKAMTGQDDPVQAAERLLNRGVRNVFISLGADGVYYANDKEKGVVSARNLPVLPLTGAGDAFCAGMTLSLLQGDAIRDCAQAGCDAAYRALLRAYKKEM